MKTSDFDYSLPLELIAQTPVEPRDQSRLMVLERNHGAIEHKRFADVIDYLKAGDVLLFNDSKVIPARLSGRKVDSGGKVEILLLRRSNADAWETLVKPGRRVSIGTRITVARSDEASVLAEVVGQEDGGIKIIKFSDEALLPELGQMALPPYIHTSLCNPERYQTVYARAAGSVAAPTAGLHFTPELISRIENKGVQCLFTTLHIGLDTFRPVTEDSPLEHPIYREYAVLTDEVASELNRAKAEGRRVICVGTTSVRVVEHVSRLNSHLGPFAGWVDLFILPGHRFRVVDGLITNFHLPKSTPLMLVTAFAGKDFVTRAYQEAIAKRYRFYSFGDAMLVI